MYYTFKLEFIPIGLFFKFKSHQEIEYDWHTYITFLQILKNFVLMLLQKKLLH